MNMQIRTVVAGVMLALLTACGKPGDVALPVVVDSFNVGTNSYVRSLAIDTATNSLWVGTSGGAMEIDLDSHLMLNTFTRKDGLANEYVFGIGVDSDGYKWFGTNAGGASRYKDGDWQVFFPMHGLADYWVYSFAEQDQKIYWIGTWAGANRVDLQTMQITTVKDELINEWVYGLSVDSKNRVWFGTEGGISMLDGESWTHWTHEDGLGGPNKKNLPASANTGLGTRDRHDLSVMVGGDASYNPNYVFATLADHDDTIWAGTWGGGVSAFDGRNWRSYTVADGLAGNVIYTIAQGPDRAYWFGTNNGLSRFDGETFINYTVSDGLLGADVYAVVVTKENEIWAGTRGGVVRLASEPDAGEATQKGQ
jgi:ligand-binding sensor domain-containing protein